MDLALNNLQRLICHKTQPTTWMRNRLPTPGQISSIFQADSHILLVYIKWTFLFLLFYYYFFFFSLKIFVVAFLSSDEEKSPN